MASDTQPPEQGPDQGAVSALRTHAEQAHTHLKALADGLDQAGVPDEIVKTLDQCAEIVGKVSDQLNGNAPEPEPQAQQPATMQSATNDMQNDLKSKRGGQ